MMCALLDLTRAAATLIVGAFAAFIAIYGITTQRKIAETNIQNQNRLARVKATLDFIVSSERDADLIEAKNGFVQQANQPGGLHRWASREKAEEKIGQQIVTVLNEFELIEIGIQEGILDEALYAKFALTTVIEYWSASQYYIKQVQADNQNEQIYINFKNLAERMRKRRARMVKANQLFTPPGSPSGATAQT
jgi:hypothetical protein